MNSEQDKPTKGSLNIKVDNALLQTTIQYGGEIRHFKARPNSPSWLVMLAGRAVFIDVAEYTLPPRRGRFVEYERLDRTHSIPIVVIDDPEDARYFVEIMALWGDEDYERVLKSYSFKRYYDQRFEILE